MSPHQGLAADGLNSKTIATAEAQAVSKIVDRLQITSYLNPVIVSPNDLAPAKLVGKIPATAREVIGLI